MGHLLDVKLISCKSEKYRDLHKLGCDEAILTSVGGREDYLAWGP